MKNTQEVINKWEKTGLLIGLSGQKKQNCSVNLENMSRYLISKSPDIIKKPKKREYMVASTIFPIIRRLVDTSKSCVILTEDLYDAYDKFLCSKPKLSENVKDKEMTLLLMFCNSYK